MILIYIQWHSISSFLCLFMYWELSLCGHTCMCYFIFTNYILHSAGNLRGARLIDLPQFAFLFPMILYFALLIENRPILLCLETVIVCSKSNQLRSWKNIKQTYHLGHKVINCNFHGQSVSSPSKAFIKRIIERNMLLLTFLAITHENIL